MKEHKLMKIVAAVAAGLLLLVVVALTLFKETVDYHSAKYEHSVYGYVKFRDRYPDSKYWEELNERKAQLEQGYFDRRREMNTVRGYDEFLNAFPSDVYTDSAAYLRDSIIQAELDFAKYGKNSLPNGSSPYEEFYGKEVEYDGANSSDMTITAPLAFDMLAVVKKKNEEGEVVAHTYIQADSTCSFRLKNGIYQVFFYIGKGWNPEKKMGNQVRGGFVSSETYSKDVPVTLYNEEITYRLSMKERNSFQKSSRREVFR